MRSTFSLLLVLSFTSCDKGTVSSTNSLTKENLSGAVESIVESTYDTQPGTSNQALRSKTISVFNENGFIMGKSYFNSDESFSYREMFRYDINLLKERVTYDSQGEVMGKDVYEYDSKQNLVSNTQLVKFPLMKELTQQFNIVYDYKDTHQEKITEEKWFVSNDSLAYRVIRKYNSNDDEIEMTKYLDKTPIYETRCSYDPSHKLMELVEMEDRGLGYVKLKKTFSYDDKGNITQIKKYGLTENHLYDINFNYTFDQKGNWVKRVMESTNDPATITIREINYF